MIYITIALLIYLGFKEWISSISIKVQQEVIKDLTLKLMARNIGDYTCMVNQDQGLPKSEPIEDPYIDISESPIWDNPESFSNAINGIKENNEE